MLWANQQNIDSRAIYSKTSDLRPLTMPKSFKCFIAAGAGNIGNYDNCSFSSTGTGTFRGNQNSNPVWENAMNLFKTLKSK
jgi:hypothetical protein